GLDYVYTLHGWLKGINSPTGGNDNQDVGKDGNAASRFAADLFGIALHYYRGDYKNKDTNNPFDQSSNLAYQISNEENQEQELFNGNIAAWSHHMQRYQPGSGGQPATWQSEAITSTYRYDQLNRIKSSRERQWNGTSTSWASPSNVHATDYSYDQNGNITQLQRRDAAGNLLDDITYTYETDENGNPINRLQEVNDPTVTADPSDIEGKHGFTYDQQGNLSRDEKEKINIDWNNQNKVHQVRQEEADKAHITFCYDATGNRIEKEVNRNDLLPDGSRSYADPTKVVTTYYVRDAQGNVMSIYEKTHRQKDDGSYESVLTQKETYLYGSDRLGVERQTKIIGTVSSATAAEAMAAEISAPETLNVNSNTPPSSNGLLPNGDEVIVTPTSKDQYEDRSYWVLTTPGGVLDLAEGFEVNVNNAEGFFAEIAAWEDIKAEEEVYAQRVIGKKQYELKDHLSNVRVVLIDQKEVVNIDETAGTYEQKAKVLAYDSYYPYGKPLGGRMSYTLDFTPRHSFNGKEDNPEWNSSIQDYGMRMYDRDKTIFYTVDPIASSYPMLSPYHFAHRNPIMNIDLDGLEGQQSIIPEGYYYPILDAPDAFTAATNASHDFIAVFWNGAVANPINNAYGLLSGIIDGSITPHSLQSDLGYKAHRMSKSNYWRLNAEDFLNPATYEDAAGMALTLGASRYLPKGGFRRPMSRNIPDEVIEAGPVSEQMAISNKNPYKIGNAWKNPSKVNVKAGGGAKVDNIPAADRLQIQRMADRWQVEITVTGSRARGTAKLGSDWDYTVNTVRPGMLHDMKFRLPKSELSRAELGRDRLEIFDGRVFPIHKNKEHITFTPNKIKD
ncbi:MAG: RHS repeat-associated core domain-containing protein, partial [Bacteroidota bacterium]